MAVNLPGLNRFSLEMLLLPDVMVTVVTEAWEVTAATEWTREADRGSASSSPFFSYGNSMSECNE